MKKLIEALHVIQDVCNEYGDDCLNCPLGKDHYFCRIKETTPNAWKINDEVQKALL